MDFLFSPYDHEAFNHLKFEVLEEWVIEEDGLETVFLNVDQSLPQLHFQTIGKTEKFNSASSFYEFLLREDPPGEIKSMSTLECGGYSGLKYEYIEKDYPEIYVYSLVVDVDEGILWFYLKVPSSLPKPYAAIISRICQSLEFK